ncbi:MAG: hypothetical protein ACI8S7_001983, partial [Candidatus Krumholzibacteriia bacterium]
AQGRTDEAAKFVDPIAAAFAGADTEVTSSCFCEP